jgi:MFS transporter, DHA1 family, tetracycline resistance protein
MAKRSPLASIFLIVLVDILGLTIILPLLPFYAESLGASPFVVGLLISSYAACQLIAGPILGQLSDRIGRKPVLLLSQCGTFAGFVLLALSHSLIPVFISRIIDGLTAGNISVAQAYIADVTTEDKRTQSFALIGIAFGIGFLIGPAASGFLADYSPTYPIVLAAALSATSILATLLLLPGKSETHESHHDAEELSLVRSWGLFKEPAVSRLFLQFTAFAFTFAMFMSGFALFAERRFTWEGQAFQTRQVGYVLAFLGLAGIFIQGGLIRPLVKRLGESRLVPAGFASMVIGLIILGLIHGISELLVTMVIFAFGSSVVRPALSTMITQAVGRKRQGIGLGMTQSLMSIAQIISPGVAGLLIQHRMLTAWAFTGAACAAIGLIWSFSGRETTTYASGDALGD